MLKNRYETVFERYLRAVKRPFLSNRQERRFDLDNGATLKNFDYLVSDAEGVNWIVDVKGRRFPGGLHSTKYWKNWTTEDDLRGLLRWEQILSAGGDEYCGRGAFVFAYLVTGERAPVPEEKIFIDRLERYAFLVVPLKTYIAEAKYISPKWKTYEIPAKRFQELAVPADVFFTAKRESSPLTAESEQI